MSETKTYAGGCHCGAVHYEVDLDLSAGVGRCNCSICHRLGRAGAIVKPEAFRLIAGESELTEYRWGSKSVEYLFCKRCGIHSFGKGHLAEVGGDFVSVNTHCLEGLDLTGVPVNYWDGRHDNWMAGPSDKPWPIVRANA